MNQTVLALALSFLCAGAYAQDFSAYHISTIVGPNGPFTPGPNGTYLGIGRLGTPYPDGSGGCTMYTNVGVNYGFFHIDSAGMITTVQIVANNLELQMINSHEYISVDRVYGDLQHFYLYTVGNPIPTWEIDIEETIASWAVDPKTGDIVYAQVGQGLSFAGVFRIPYKGLQAVRLPLGSFQLVSLGFDEKSQIIAYTDDYASEPTQGKRNLWRIGLNGTVTNLLHGSGSTMDKGSLPAAKASLLPVTTLAVDARGNIYLAEENSYNAEDIRVLTPAGMVVPLAGNAIAYASTGDGGLASSAGFTGINSMAADSRGFVYIVDGSSLRELIPPGYPLPPPPAKPVIRAVAQAATFNTASLSPGSVFTIFGTGLATPGLQVGTPQAGHFPSWIGGTSVLVAGLPAPLLYVSDTQISGVVPQNISVGIQSVTVNSPSFTSDSFSIRVVNTQPGLFTANSSGKGAAAALNQDGSVNGPSNPTRAGSVVVLYGTGFGVTGPDGAVATGIESVKSTVIATIADKIAQVLYAGAAPGLIEGVTQINVQLPQGISSGAQEIRLLAESAASPGGVTLYIGQ